MRNKIFLDTNILLDLLFKQRIYAKNSVKIVSDFVLKDYLFVIDSLSLATIFYIGCEKNKVWEATKEFIKNIIYDDDLWEIYYLNHMENREILNFMDMHFGSDYEDLHQYICAKNSGCEAIITNDKNFPEIDIELIRTYEI